MRALPLAAALLACATAIAAPAGPTHGREREIAAGPWDALGLIAIDEEPLDPAVLRGRVVLVVNVASFSGYTPQYAELQALYARHAAEGLTVLGVPSNAFAGQEPGTNREIEAFGRTRYGVTFPRLAKQEVDGPGRSALYAWLIDSPAGAHRDVGWDFEKFLVDRDGVVIGRWPSHVPPSDPHVVAAIARALAAR